MDAEIAEFLGLPAPPTLNGKTTRAAQVLENLTAARRQEREDLSNAPHMMVADALHGVTVSWLAQVFGMDPTTVKKRLSQCPPMARRKNGFVYDLKIAAPYLVQPKVDIDAYMRTVKVADLPTHLQEAYWSAKRKQQQWEENAAHLWRAEAVQEVFGDVFKAIKTSMQLWPDNVERATGLSPEQRKMLVGMSDALQDDIHKRLIAIPMKTFSTLHEAVASGEVVPVDEDDFSHLV